MTNENKPIERNVCHIRLQLSKSDALAKRNSSRIADKIRNCDIFIDGEEHNLIIYTAADVRLLSFYSAQQFDTKDMKNLVINFNTKESCYELTLPFLPQISDDDGERSDEKGQLEQQMRCNNRMDLWKLKRITDSCQLRLDDHDELVKFEANFEYGFACKFSGEIRSGECDLESICRMSAPHVNSPLQRSIDREIDELKDFSRDQYKLNFVELQVPEGHENPMKYSFNFCDSKPTHDEDCLLHNLTKKGDFEIPDSFDQGEVDCGLISILLAICYDVRSTSNEPTCESAWTRSTLTATLTYFEPFTNIKDVVISFLRRSLIYPLYRNYDFGRLCVQDAIDTLHRSRAWLLKQLLATHDMFLNIDSSSRAVFNRYYLEDYIRYVHNETHCPTTHLQMLAHNLKNVLLDVYKKHLRLNLAEIETELLKELITDIHVSGASTSEEESELDDEDDDDDCGEDDTETSESEENSVIESQQCSSASKS